MHFLKHDNYEGEIRINGKNLREYTQSQLKQLYSVVYQDFAKYYVRLKDNILLGDANGKERFDKAPNSYGKDYMKRMEEAIAVMELEECVNHLPQFLIPLECFT